MEIIKATKKPVQIEAMHWDGTVEGATPIVLWMLNNSDMIESTRKPHYQDARRVAGPGRSIVTKPACIVIPTLEGNMEASSGDYVIRGVQGEFYPCKPDIFKATYDIGETQGRAFVIDVETGDWVSEGGLTFDESARIAASVLPGVSAEQVALWHESVMEND